MKGSVISAVLLGCLIILLSGGAYGQTATHSDSSVVLLATSGAVLRGVIVEDKPGDKVVMILDKDNSRAEIPYKKIFKITDEAGLEEARADLKARKSSSWAAKFNTPSIFSLGGVLVSDTQPTFTATAVMGYHYEENVFVGIGVGWDAFPDGGATALFVHGRTILSHAPTSPYIYAEGGYAVGDYRSGSYRGYRFGGGLGITHAWPGNFGFAVQLGGYSLVGRRGERYAVASVTAGLAWWNRHRQ